MLRCLSALALLLIAHPALAQFDDEDNPYAPGLTLTLEDRANHTVRRLTPFLAYQPSQDARLADGNITASLTGVLRTTAAGEHRFHIHGNGEIELKIAGHVIPKTRLTNGWFVSEAMKLPVDYLPIEVTFRGSPNDRFTIAWSGPRFGLEPIPARLLFHLAAKSVGNEYERGHALSRTLRCGQCHQGEASIGAAPALDHLTGRVAKPWLENWLATDHPVTPTPKGQEPTAPRRMPALGLTNDEAKLIADWLLTPRKGDLPLSKVKEPKPKKGKPTPDAKLGEQLFVSTGCIACHTWKDLGAAGWYGGGDLTRIADKRPAAFFHEWLADPAKLNRDHRMPTFDLGEDERYALALFLAEQKTPDAKTDFEKIGGTISQDAAPLIQKFHCAACHRLPEQAEKPTAPFAAKLDAKSHWDQSCLGEPDAAKHRPGYRLDERDARALRRYFGEKLPAAKPTPPDGATLLAESNCLSCHSRQGPREVTPLLPPPLADKLAAVGKKYPDLAANLGALSPPSLNSVGDKLTDEALTAAITRKGESRRPYLHVKMPRFPLSDAELQTLTAHLIADDRLPPRTEIPKLDTTLAERYRVAGGRLVSGDGFGCTSCHRVGEVLPPPGPASARGPDLAMLGSRIRREWYDRWCRDPARIVPRMEMPALQIPVAGVLGDKLDDQIAAVWHVLNTPGFEPPPPAPVRILRHNENKWSPKTRPPAGIIITDGLRAGGKMYTKPILTGIPGRQNILVDLETASLIRWTVGDTARQLTKGKSWLWEAGGTTVLETGLTTPDISLITNGKESDAKRRGQFITEADEWFTTPGSGGFVYKLTFAEGTIRINRGSHVGFFSGFSHVFVIDSVPQGSSVRIRILSKDIAKTAKRSDDGRSVQLPDRFGTRIGISMPETAKFSEDGSFLDLSPDNRGWITLGLSYQSNIPVDEIPVVKVVPAELKVVPTKVAPGFTGERLPLSPEIMPTGLSWRPNGRLVFSSLKGQVYEATDSDGDGYEDILRVIADGLSAPYGVNADDKYVDVISKFGLLRLREQPVNTLEVELLASGWGYTLDYHDWAVGLPRTSKGEYYIGIPCEQDKRSVAAAKHHSELLKLVPREPTKDDPRRFRIETVSRGSRFPMGLALNRSEDLFVSDNQGNYTPFNEINHVRPGVHFGFINSLERSDPAPKVMPAAIDIPHPWCRSVNGICFLDTPATAKTKDAFGPFEGHMVGCEFNGKRLVRMSLEKVNGEFQGAVYPLSAPPSDPAKGFLGPLVCAVSPRGELYVGGVWDSGWGGGNNVGEIVKVTMQPDKLPCGIGEVKATKDGFTIDFVKPVDRNAAANLANYAIESYRREPTPAYGGPDLDRRKEKLASVEISPDGLRATLTLGEMRAGFLYEFILENLAPNSSEFFPAEAHYTLRTVPK